MKNFIRTLQLVFCFALVSNSLATHLVGGNLGYTYLGETSPGSQVYRYQVNMQFYMNCGPNSNYETFQELLAIAPGGVLPVGVYLQDPQNPNSDKAQQAIVNLSLVNEMQIVPPFPMGCDIGDGLCTLLGDFQGTVDLPLNFSGYHLYFQMCCRNLDISNLANPNDTGIGYYAYIPPTLVNNSSPVFLGLPTPLLCTSDTATFINSASDPDGDQLIFSFERPYNSISIAGGIQQPPNTLPWPVPEVTHAGGYSTAQPFGAGGYSFINGATGLTSYYSSTQGYFVISVEIKEFRNGQLIGRTRRDLQLQVKPCSPNATPAITGNLALSYTVNAGEQLCFDMAFADTDIDSLFIVGSGTIFDASQFNPPATLVPTISPAGQAGAEFCWSTLCDQGQSQPYLFSVSVVDNGCPPKNLDVVFQVNVIPFIGPSIINGPLQLCAGQTGSTYSTPDIAGATFNWVVNGGTISTGQGTSSITVNWGNSGAGTVSVSATNALNCTSDPVTTNVTIAALPVANAGADITICNGAGAAIGGSPTGPPGSSYSWSPANTLSSGTTANPQATPTTNTTYIVQVSNSGCISQDTVNVNISAASVDAGADTALCQGQSTQLQATGSGSVVWSPATALSDPNSPDPIATPTSTTTYVATLTNGDNCAAQDSVIITVNALPIANAGTDTTACINELVSIGGSPTGPVGSTYLWSPTTGLNNPTSANPTITIASTQTYTVTVTSGDQCSSTDAITINALAVPDVDAGPDTTICAGTMVQLNGTGNGTLQWTPIFGLSDPNIGNPIANPETTITYTLTVTGGNLCVNTDQTTVTVNVLPNANAGPDLSLCAGDSIQLQATGPGMYNWSPAGTLSDPNAQNPYAYPIATTTYILTLSDAISCASTDTVTVTVSIPSDAGTNGTTTICSFFMDPFDLFDLLGGNPDTDGVWNDPNNASSNGIFTPGTSIGGIYTYTVTANAPCTPAIATVDVLVVPVPNAGVSAPAELCSSGAAINLITFLGSTAQPGGTWVDSNNQPVTGVFDPATDAPDTFTYTVSGVGPCIDSQAQVIVSIIDAPDPGEDATISICENGTAFIMTAALGGNPDPTGTWMDPNNTAHSDMYDPATDNAGVYTFTVPGGTGCPDQIAQLTITEDPLPNVDAGADLYLCPGFSVQLNGVGNGTPSWTPASDLNDPAIATPEASPVNTTTFTLTITDGNGCAASDAVVVVVSTDPPLDPGPDLTICDGQPVTLGGNPTTIPGVAIFWNPAIDLDDATLLNPTASPSVTTTYTVTAQSDTCTSQSTVLVTLQGSIAAAFSVVLEPNCDGVKALFVDQSTGATNWFWDFGDGTSSTQQNPQHEFFYGGPINVTLTVSDGVNCDGMQTQTIAPGNFTDHVSYDIPNIFTPNRDNKNDLFTFSTDARVGSCTSMQVFNRWGQIVFRNTGNNITWDGYSLAGEPCVEGTYFYTIAIGNTELKGNVLLKR